MSPHVPEVAGRPEGRLSLDETEMRQCTSGESRPVATISRLDVRARLRRIASHINSLCGSDAYRSNKLARAVKEWQMATVLKHASPPHPWKSLGFEGKGRGDLFNRREELPLVGWSDAAP